MRIIVSVGVMWLMAVLATPAGGAPGIDLHWLWDDRCAECHGHAGDFARKFLRVSGGRLQGRHHVDDLYGFLHNHYLAGNEVDSVYKMLFAQASNQARFKDECSSCHDTAAGLVRNTLELRDGVLCSRNSGRPVGDFLNHHRGLTPEDAGFFTNLLTRVAREVYRP